MYIESLGPIGEQCRGQSVLLARKGKGEAKREFGPVLQVVVFHKFGQTGGNVVEQLKKSISSKNRVQIPPCRCPSESDPGLDRSYSSYWTSLRPPK